MVSTSKVRQESPSRPRPLAICGLFLALLIPATATAADPLASPHRHIPAKNLIAYCEFEGLDAHADAWKGTSAHAALTKTKAGTMISELARQGADWLLKKDGAFFTGADAIALYEHLIRHGFAIAVHSLGHDAYSATIVLNDLGSQELRPSVKRLKQQIEAVEPLTPTRIRGRDVFYLFEDRGEPVMPGTDDEPFPLPLVKKRATARSALPTAPLFTTWYERDNVIIVLGPRTPYDDIPDPDARRLSAEKHTDLVAAILNATDGTEPNVETHAGYRAARDERKDLKDFGPTGLFFMNPTDDKGLITAMLGIGEGLNDQALREVKPPAKPASADDDDTDFTPEQIEALGLNGLKRVCGRFGFQDEAFLTDLRIEAPAPRKGINTWFDQPSFRKNQLPPLPRGVTDFAVGSLDLERTYQNLLDASAAIYPSLLEDFRQFEKIVHNHTGVRFREDISKFLGPTWCIYLAPPRPGERKPREKSDPTAHVLLAGLKDAKAFAKVLDVMVSQFNDKLGTPEPAEDDRGQEKTGKKTPSSFLERLPAPDVGYRLASSKSVTLGLGDEVQPTIMIGKSYIAVAATPFLAREALASETRVDGRWKPTGKLVNAFEGLPADLTFLAVADHQGSSVPRWIADLPRIMQLMMNMSQEQDLDNVSARCFLDMIGLPRPGRVNVKIDRSQIPADDDIRPFLFPSVLAATVDERGYRLISRGAFPLALLANETKITSWFGAGWNSDEGFRFKESIKFTIFGFDPTQW